MKKLFLGFLMCSYGVMVPSLAYAQVPFGGLDVFTYPVTCSIPPLPPEIVVWGGPCHTYPIPLPNLPPVATFDLFVLMKGLGIPPSGIIAVPIGMPLLYPNYLMTPGSWALGFQTPGGPIGGIFIPGLTIYPPYSPPICFESACIPIAYPVGTLNPNTGTAPAGW